MTSDRSRALFAAPAHAGPHCCARCTRWTRSRCTRHTYPKSPTKPMNSMQIPVIGHLKNTSRLGRADQHGSDGSHEWGKSTSCHSDGLDMG